ncbi:hypothetical protein SLEP1_g58123 [Rubroshorea leprosula]|uniref:Uncharacterized protein n=1 Tax=Rubroshorea leprosula TaxID=152421 RepID=A0AAV5MNQ4_9ROSI|nr:hypothetical protein SLEP1_g58123 [Rubroshorea leprosula]
MPIGPIKLTIKNIFQHGILGGVVSLHIIGGSHKT